MTSLSGNDVPGAAASTGAGATVDHVRAWVAARVVPFLLDDEDDDPALAQAFASRALADCDAVTGREIQLAGQILAFGFAALDCLRGAQGGSGEQISLSLRLQRNAARLNAMADKSRRVLAVEQSLRRRAPMEADRCLALDEAEF